MKLGCCQLHLTCFTLGVSFANAQATLQAELDAMPRAAPAVVPVSACACFTHQAIIFWLCAQDAPRVDPTPAVAALAVCGSILLN